MADITDRESLEAWLENRPREDAAVIASRAALRVLPTLRSEERFEDQFEMLCVPSFIASAASWVAATGPKQRNRIASANSDAHQAALSCAYGHNAVEAASNAAAVASADVQYPLRGAVRAVEVAATAAARAHPGSYSNSYSDHYDVGGDTRLWRAAKADAEALESGKSPIENALWYGNPDGPFIGQWTELKAFLLGHDPGWHVWTDWYEARLYGRSFNRDLEEARVVITADDLWKQGAKAVIDKIAQLIDEHRPNLRMIAAQRISQRPMVAAETADQERRKLERRIEELRACLPNNHVALEEAQQEIAVLETMKRSLDTVFQEAKSLPENATPEDVAEAAEAVECLADQLKNWVGQYLTKERADAAADAVVLGGLVGFLIWVGMPPWLAGTYLIARFNGYDVIEKIKAIIRPPK